MPSKGCVTGSCNLGRTGGCYKPSRISGRYLASLASETFTNGKTNADEQIRPPRACIHLRAGWLRRGFGPRRRHATTSGWAVRSGGLQARVRHDVDLRRTSARLLAPNLQLGPGSEVARSRPPRVGALAKLFRVVRVVSRVGHDQSPLRARLLGVVLTSGLELHPDRFCGRDAHRREKMRA